MKRIAALSLLLWFAAVAAVYGQTPTPVPTVITAPTIFDFGNGPLQLRVVSGQASIFASQSSGVGSTAGSSTSLTLTSTPTTPPCVGCVIAGSGIVAGTTVTAYNGTTGVTLSAAMTVPASTPLTWGAACPASVGSLSYIQANASVDYFQLYSTARICAASPGGPSTLILTLPLTTASSGGGGGSVTQGTTPWVTQDATVGTNTSTTATNTGNTTTQVTTLNTNFGVQADAACGTDNGTCDLLALVKRSNQRLSSMITALGSPFQAGGSLASNQSVNVAQINGVAPLMGAGNTGTGSPRVTIATDQAAIATAGQGATGSAFPANATGAGVKEMTGSAMQPVLADPCMTRVRTTTPINISTATTTRIVAPSASNRTYICALFLYPAGTTNIGIVEGTGGTCGTGTAGVIGGTTAATGINATATAGFSLPNTGYFQAATAGTNVDLCLITSAAIQVAGNVITAQAP